MGDDNTYLRTGTPMFPMPDDLQREYLKWNDIDALIDHLIPQFRGEFDGLLMIARSGLIPGGYLAEALGIEHVLTATIDFAPSIERKLAWPTFVQFPSDALLVGRRILIVDDMWASGHNIVFAKGRVSAAGARAETSVLHYRPRSNLFPSTGPDYFGAITDRYIVYPWEPPPLADSTVDTRPTPPVN